MRAWVTAVCRSGARLEPAKIDKSKKQKLGNSKIAKPKYQKSKIKNSKCYTVSIFFQKSGRLGKNSTPIHAGVCNSVKFGEHLFSKIVKLRKYFLRRVQTKTF